MWTGGGVQLSENVSQAKKKKKKKKKKKGKRREKTEAILSLKYGINPLSRPLFTFKFIFDREWSFCTN